MTFCNASAEVLDESVLLADHAQAEVFWKVRLGRSCMYYTQPLKTYYVPYTALKTVFMRVKSTLSRVCCGTAEIKEYALILCGDDAELATVSLDSEEKCRRILAALTARGVPTGKPAAKQ